MGEEAYHSVSLQSEIEPEKWLILRRTYGSPHVYLGIGKGEDDPDVLIELTGWDQKELRKMLREHMSAKMSKDYEGNEP